MEHIYNILSQYGITQPVNIKHLHNDTWQINETYILKKSESIAELHKVLMINKFLKEENIPVAEYMQPNSGKDYVVLADEAYVLMRKMRGAHIESFYGECTDVAYNLGIEIARLHKALRKLESCMSVDIYDSDLTKDLKSIALEIENNSIDIPRRIIESCLEFENDYHSLARQLIHRDIWSGNILFENGKLTGFLDFDSGEINARLYDMVYFGQSILVNGYKDDDFVAWWHDFFGSLLKGYNSEDMLHENELKAIHKLCLAMQLVSISYYLWIKEKKHLIPNRVEMAKWAFCHEQVFDFTGIKLS